MARVDAELFEVAGGVRRSIPVGGFTANAPPPPLTPVLLAFVVDDFVA
jgi:hypothetical protein